MGRFRLHLKGSLAEFIGGLDEYREVSGLIHSGISSELIPPSEMEKPKEEAIWVGRKWGEMQSVYFRSILDIEGISDRGGICMNMPGTHRVHD